MSLGFYVSQSPAVLDSIVYHATNVSIAFLVLYLIVLNKSSSSLRLAGLSLHLASTLLVVLSASHLSGWTLFLNQLASSALPFLAAHPFRQTLFQLANALGIYHVFNTSANLFQVAISVLVHIYLVLSSLGHSSQARLKSILCTLSFAQARQLSRLQKLRELTLDDLWPVPERYQLCNSFSELKFNVDEPLFVIRAIVGMIWKPMISLHIANMLLQIIPIIKTMMNGYIYQCLDSPESNTYYRAYMAAVGLIMLRVLSAQGIHLTNYVKCEKSRIKNAITLEMKRVPLVHFGIMVKDEGWRDSYINYIVDNIVDLHDAIPGMFGVLATLAPIYYQVGWYAFIPLGVTVATSAVEICLDRCVGREHKWDSDNNFSDCTIDEVYFGIKTIKMFGWERMFLDSKLKKPTRIGRKLPWYAPLVRLAWKLVDLASEVAAAMSIHMAVDLHLRTTSLENNMMNSQLLEVTEHVDNLQLNITWVTDQLRRVTYIIENSYRLEPLLCRETFNTIAHKDPVSTNAMPAVTMDNCNFRWYEKSTTLKNITLQASSGELVAVVGKTGSGKSSLLLAMCRELELTKGSGTVVGRVGYLEQSPWIMNDTMRANILFGREYDEVFYWQVVDACALTRDLELWPDRDLTMIGERGINISGGQRARLALARTVYSQADIYILDDPLSAVDAHVKRHILDNVILSSGLLGNKLRIVTTHAESMMPFCNQIITLSDGTATVKQQVPKEHKYTAPTAPLASAEAATSTLQESDKDAASASLGNEESSSEKSKDDKEKPPSKSLSLMDNVRFIIKLCSLRVIGTMIIAILMRPASHYILEGYRLDALRKNASLVTVDHGAVLQYLKINLIIRLAKHVLPKIEEYLRHLIAEGSLRDSIMSTFTSSIIYAPLSLFENTNRHCITSAYYDGMYVVEKRIPEFLLDESAYALESMLAIWRSSQIVPQLLFIVPLIVWIRAKANKLTDPAIESLNNVEKEVGIRHSQTSSIIDDGSLMIRLFGVEPFFISRYITDRDEDSKIEQAYKALDVYSQMISQCIRKTGEALFVFSAVVQSQFTSHRVKSGELTIIRNDLINLVYNIERLVGLPGRVRNISNEVTNYRQFCDIETEGPYEVEECRVPKEWPDCGKVEFKNLCVKYGASQQYALKNINLNLSPGEKIGIVGRTGAGKSTLAKAIFRLLDDNVEGSIEIDNRDIGKFGVGDFRPKLGIIPQESTMFSGSVRHNLDPLQEFTIEDIWAAIIKGGIAELLRSKRKGRDTRMASDVANINSEDKDDAKTESKEMRIYKQRWERSGWQMRIFLLVFDSKPDIQDNTAENAGVDKEMHNVNSSFSDGQKQLFSLCRLLMRKRKVLVLDEATADVDLETDRQMQELIRKEFSDCTVLTIAHRLDTIMNSDRVIVMEKGEIAEMGPPKELIANGGMFAELLKSSEYE